MNKEVRVGLLECKWHERTPLGPTHSMPVLPVSSRSGRRCLPQLWYPTGVSLNSNPEKCCFYLVSNGDLRGSNRGRALPQLQGESASSAGSDPVRLWPNPRFLSNFTFFSGREFKMSP
jgi:hypothetical protein